MQQRRVGPVQPHVGVAEPDVELQRQSGFHAGPDQVPEQDRVLRAGPTASSLQRPQEPAGGARDLGLRSAAHGSKSRP